MTVHNFKNVEMKEVKTFGKSIARRGGEKLSVETIKRATRFELLSHPEKYPLKCCSSHNYHV